MTIDVSPTTKQPTHHIKLTKGGVEVGLIACDNDGTANPNRVTSNPTPRGALKMYTGRQKHSDMQPPFFPECQEDWSGGRGQEDLDDDHTRYYDGYCCDTRQEKEVILGPQVAYTTGIRKGNYDMPYRTPYSDGISSSQRILWYWEKLIGDQRYFGVKFTPDVTRNNAYVHIVVRKKGSPASSSIGIRMYSTSGGLPVTSLGTVTWDEFDDPYISLDVFVEYDQALTAGTTYCLVVYASSSSDDEDNCFEVLARDCDAAMGVKSTSGSSWSTHYSKLFCRSLEEEKPYKSFFFEYKRALYQVVSYIDGSTPRVFINGDQGVASAGSDNTLTDSSKSWITNQWMGCVLLLTVGDGSTAETNYRVIKSNTATAITTVDDWDINPTSGTEYCILGSDVWTELTGHGLTGPITNVLSFQQIAYICQGNSVAIRRMRRYNSGGTWTTEWAAEDGMGAYLCPVPTSDGMKIYKAKNSYPSSISKATAVWGGGASTVSNLVFDTETVVGDCAQKITNLACYGEPKTLYIFMEGAVLYLNIYNDNAICDLPLNNLTSIRSELNGKTVLVSNLYLFFSLLKSWQRYYKSNLKNVGPTLDAGLPYLRQGVISAATCYEDEDFLAIDAGEDGYSSILSNNGSGWHEVFRAKYEGWRIRSLYVLPIPGDEADRLYFSMGSETCWLPLAPNPYRSNKSLWSQNCYHYTYESYFITSWIYLELQEIVKYFHSVYLIAENLNVVDDYGVEMYVDYQTDDDENWTTLGTVFDTPLGQTVNFSSSNDVEGKRIRLRVRFYTNDNTKTPLLKSLIVNILYNLPFKYTWTIDFRLGDGDKDLLGQPDDYPTAKEKRDLLNTWAAAASPMYMNSISSLDDGQYVKFADGMPVRRIATFIKENKAITICRANLVEL